MTSADDPADDGSAPTAATSHGERSRQALLNAAEARYRAHGYQATRLADITSDAGLTTGSLYRHFAGKDDLLAVLFDQYRLQLDEALGSAASLGGACTAWLEVSRQNPGLLRSAQEALRPRQPQRERWASARDGWERRMGILLPDRLVGPSRRVAAAVLIDGLEYFALAEAAGWFEVRPAELVGEQIERLIRSGLYHGPGSRQPGPELPAGITLDRTYFSWSVSEGHVLPTSARGGRTWEQIRHAAMHVFADVGFRTTTIADIADAAGVSSATVYRYFEDKEDLLLNLLTATENDLVERRMYPLDSTGRHPVRAVYEGFMKLHRDRAGVFLAWSELNTPGTEYERAWIDLHEILMTQLEKVLRRGQRADLIGNEVDLRLMTEFYGAVHERSAYTRVALGRGLAVSDREVAEVIDEIYNGGLG